jgi:hypothetical protein
MEYVFQDRPNVRENHVLKALSVSMAFVVKNHHLKMFVPQEKSFQIMNVSIAYHVTFFRNVHRTWSARTTFA